MQVTTIRPRIMVSADGTGVVSHAGSRLLADLADATTLTAQLGEVLAAIARPRARHGPGRVLVDLAVVIADGVEAISEIAVLADQPALFGLVASDSRCWLLLDRLGSVELNAIAAARAAAREMAWAQRAEATGAAFAPSRVAGTPGIAALVIDLDAHVVVCHSEKEQGFDGARFTGHAGFRGTQFTGDASFNSAQFTDDVKFNRAQFTGRAGFDKAQFAQQAWFLRARFTYARFDGAQFTKNASFNYAQFTEYAWFDEAQFAGHAWFDKAQFTPYSYFTRVQFTGQVFFGTAEFVKGAGFEGARTALGENYVVWPIGWTVREAAEGEEDGWMYLVRVEDEQQPDREDQSDGEAGT